MRVPDKVKCPRCKKLVQKFVLKATNGRCNNCGYLLANSLNEFAKKKELL